MPREDARVGERALERVVLRGGCARRRSRRSTSSGSRPPRSCAAKRRLARDEVQRRPTLRCRPRSGSASRRRNRAPATRCGRCSAASGRSPVQTAGDHQMEHQPELAVERRSRCACRAGAARARRGPRASLGGGSTVRRMNGLARRTRSSGRPTSLRAADGMQVGLDVGQLGQGAQPSSKVVIPKTRSRGRAEPARDTSVPSRSAGRDPGRCGHRHGRRVGPGTSRNSSSPAAEIGETPQQPLGRGRARARRAVRSCSPCRQRRIVPSPVSRPSSTSARLLLAGMASQAARKADRGAGNSARSRRSIAAKGRVRASTSPGSARPSTAPPKRKFGHA